MNIWDQENFFQDINDEKIRVMGNGVFNGNVTCERLSVTGQMTSSGIIDCSNKLSVAGKLVANSDIYARHKLGVPGELLSNGNISVGYSMKLYGRLKTSGSFTIHGDFSVYGNFECAGDLIIYGNLKTYSSLKVGGNVFCSGNLNLGNPHSQINGSITAYSVNISGNSEVFGQIYFVDVLTGRSKNFQQQPIQIEHSKLLELMGIENKGQEEIKSNEKTQMKFCVYCGAEITPGGKFCPGCGSTLPE